MPPPPSGRFLLVGLAIMVLAAACAGGGMTATAARTTPTAATSTAAPQPPSRSAVTAAPAPEPPRGQPVVTQPAARLPVRVAKPPLRVELWGDSLSAQAAPYFDYFLGLSGTATARAHSYGGTALCDWFSDIRREIDPANPTGFHPQVAVIQFAGDAFTTCMHDKNGVAYSGQALVAKYAADSAYAIGMFALAKIPVYFVSTPISRGDAAQGYVGNTPLGVMYSKLPSRFPAGGMVRFADAAAAVEWHGHYSATLPCAPWETCTGRWPDGTKTVVVREADGVHFCPVTEISVDGAPTCLVPMPGGVRFALAIAGPILHDISAS